MHLMAVTEELLVMAADKAAPSPTGQRVGSPEYTGCRLCKSLEHYARDCPQAGQRKQEWAKAVLQETVEHIREISGTSGVDEAVTAVLDLDFVQEESQPGTASAQ